MGPKWCCLKPDRIGRSIQIGKGQIPGKKEFDETIRYFQNQLANIGGNKTLIPSDNRQLT